MPIEGTEGPDEIEIGSRSRSTPTSETVDAKGGDDRVIVGWSPMDDVDQEEGFHKVQFAIDGGAGHDTLELVIHAVWDDGYPALVDARTGQYQEFTFTGFERVEITGGHFHDTFYGLDGNDILDGLGSTDRLHGGKGDDFYFADKVGDQIFENADEGHDTIKVTRSNVAFEIPANVEDLLLAGDSSGFGNELDNHITGAGGPNKLFGRGGDDTLDGRSGNDLINGGAGHDTMFGGEGNDVIVVNEVGEDAFGGGGIDLVESSVSHSLRVDTERLTLTGTAAINGSGNALANVLLGNAAANTLSGLGGDDSLDGGAGADRLRGGDGDDHYVVDNVGDRVEESAGSDGFDSVLSSVSFTLSQNIERLTLAGRSEIDGTGNAQANSIIGNDANNVLRGHGGADTLSGRDGSDSLQGGDGPDRLYGGAGNDTLRGDAAGSASAADRFYFTARVYDTVNVDRILDFDPANDLIYLNRSVFEAAGSAGALKGAAFHSGPAAADATDRIIHDPATGNLYFDPDGTGLTDQVLFATLTPGIAVTAADFFLYG